nr:glycosyltransferase [Bacillus sp. MUM 116]
MVPVYNSESFIDKCIGSIINQTYKNLEIIIVNDGSTDKSEERIKNFTQDDVRVIYYCQTNAGPSKARNMGINMSKGEYILFVDSDDTVHKDYVEKLVMAAMNLNLDFVAGGYIDFSIHGKINLNHFWNGKSMVSKKQLILNTFQGVGGTLWGKVFKRGIILNRDIRLDPEIFMCEDLLFVLQYIMHCNRCGVLNENLYNYNRLNENSISKRINIGYLKNLILVINKIEEILNKNYTNLSDNILAKRVQSLVETFLVLQHSTNWTKEDKDDIVKSLYTSKYFLKYKTNFSSGSFKGKLLFFLIRKNKSYLVYYYTLLLFKSQQIKDFIKLKLYRNNLKEMKLTFEEEGY